MDAKLESNIRRATAYLDQGLAWQWTPKGGMLTADHASARSIELGVVAASAGDRWEDIDQRLAWAVYETMTFADYIGAP